MDERLENQVKEILERCDTHRREVRDSLADGAKKFALQDARIGSLEIRHTELSDVIREMTTELKEMVKCLNSIKLDLATGRPSWLLAIIITGLFSAMVGMAVYIVKII